LSNVPGTRKRAGRDARSDYLRYLYPECPRPSHELADRHISPASTGQATQRPLSLSAVVPCYNEQDSLQELYRRLSGACRDAVGNDYELVLVDDGSFDQTWADILELSARDDRVTGVRLSRNHGHQLALTAGLRICRGSRILIIDADLQDPPELLVTMMQLMDDGADVVYGQRVERAGESFFKRLSANLFYRLLNSLVDHPIPVDTGDFRLISRRVLDLLDSMPERHRFVRGMVSWIGFKQVPLRYHRDRRFAGETKYPLRKMLRLGIDAITGFSIKPLQIAAYLGLIFATLGAAVLMYTLYSWAVLGTVQGWASVMTAVLVLGSVQLLMLGLFGAYLGRLFVQAKRRPLFVIESVVRSDDRSSECGKPRMLTSLVSESRNGLQLSRDS
jgi:glycosyltransferase involved in cell wall biosynthesis